MNQIVSHEALSQQQLALDIFQSLGIEDSTIVESGSDFGLRKSHLLVDVSDIGLLARRVLNGVYFIGQGEPDAESHTVDMRYFKWLINYSNSNNVTHLKKVIREAQKSAVQVNVIDPSNPEEDSWVSVPMLGPAGFKKNQFTFKIPVELRGQLRDPERYTLLSMRILAGFKSQYSLELYERLTVYRAEGASPWWSLDEFRSLIRVDDLKIANDFRYFKRDIIVPAVDEINEISDIDVMLELRRTGRFISHLRFTVKASDKHMLMTQVSASKELYDILTHEFGLSDAELDEISGNREKWSDDRITAAIEFTRHRIRTGKVLYPGRYLMMAIRDGCRVGLYESKAAELEDAQRKEKAKQLAAAQQQLELARKNTPVKEVDIPAGEALLEAWNAFLTSPHIKAIKERPASYEEADARARAAFKGFLSGR